MNKNANATSKIFCLLLAFELVFFAVLIGQARMVKGHDAFIHFSLQYYFLNHVVNYGDIPLWIPYMTHGTLAAWWYTIQAGLLQNVFLFTGALLKPFNFLYIYDLNVLVDELLLGVGVWLLALRLFRNAWTALFAAVTACGSCIWMSQPWFNFHFYYAVPLILWLGHRFLDTGRIMYLFLGGNFLIFQVLGNLPYFLPVIALVVFLYFAFYIAFSPRGLRRLPRLDMSKVIICVMFFLVNLWCAYQLLAIGTDQIVNYNYEREVNSVVPLQAFLHYGGNQNISRWLELLLGVSPAEDYTLYIGFVAVPLIILGLLHLRRRYWHIVTLIVVLFLISQGTLVTSILYWAWPMMKYYRHLSLLAVFIKLFLIFLAAAGFQSLFIKRNCSKYHTFFLALAVLFTTLSIWLFYLSVHYNCAVSVVSAIMHGLIPLGRYEWTPVYGQEPVIKNVLSAPLLGLRLFKCGILSLLSGFWFMWMGRGNRGGRIFIWLLLALQAGDLMQYKLAEMHIRTTALDQKHRFLTAFEPLPYYVRRDLSFDRHNPRTAALWEIVPFPGVLHWSLNAFLFEDQVEHPYRTDYWLKPLDELIRTLNHEPLNDFSITPKGLIPYAGWKFPLMDKEVYEMAGVTQDKVQFFSTFDLNDRSRLPLHYQVLRFTSNELQLRLEPFAQKGVWLYYSDVWHPFWKAAVDNVPARVLRAKLAYKAVYVPKGSQIVKFYFSSPALSLLYCLFAVNALFWLVYIGRLVFLQLLL